jgi:hypothetical protein
LNNKLNTWPFHQDLIVACRYGAYRLNLFMTKTNVYENKIHVFKNKRHGKLVLVKMRDTRFMQCKTKNTR